MVDLFFLVRITLQFRTTYIKPSSRVFGRGELVIDTALILHVIISRMKARKTVQTCVLSRRWRHLWRSAPCLDLDRTEFFESSYGLPTQEELHPPQEQLDRFQDFLHRSKGTAVLDTSDRLLFIVFTQPFIVFTQYIPRVVRISSGQRKNKKE